MGNICSVSEGPKSHRRVRKLVVVLYQFEVVETDELLRFAFGHFGTLGKGLHFFLGGFFFREVRLFFCPILSVIFKCGPEMA